MMIGCEREQLDWNNENVADEMQVSVVCLLKATRKVKRNCRVDKNGKQEKIDSTNVK